MLRTAIPLAAWLVAAFAPHAAAAADWDNLGPRDRYEAMRNYEQHRRLPKQERRDIERQYQRWQEMPQEDRRRVRRNYERLQQLSPDERRRFERKYEKWRDQRD